MQVTGTILLFIPLAILVTLGRPVHILTALLIGSIFTTGSPINIGSNGIKLFFAVACVFILRFIFTLARQRFHVVPGYWHISLPFILFMALGLISAFIYPVIFQGQVFVLGPRAGIWNNGAEVLTFSATNINQASYLVFNTVLQLALTLYLANFAKVADLRIALVISVLTALFFMILPYFPGGTSALELLAWTDIASGGGLATLDDGTLRINGPFTETSVMASWMAPCFAMLFCTLMIERRLRLVVPVACSALLLLFSTSSSALVGLVACFVFSALVTFPYAGISPLRLIKALSPLLLLLSPILVLASTYVYQILEVAVFSKGTSGSYFARLYGDFISVQALVSTHYIGVGLGSHRGSSGLLTILACTGVAGFFLFCWSYVRLFREFLRGRSVVKQLAGAGVSERVLALVPAAFTGLFTLMAIFATSVPDIANPIFPLLTSICMWQGLSVYRARVKKAVKLINRAPSPA